MFCFEVKRHDWCLGENSPFNLDLVLGIQYSQTMSRSRRSRFYGSEANVHNQFKMAVTNQIYTHDLRRRLVRLPFTHGRWLTCPSSTSFTILFCSVFMYLATN